MFSGLELAHQNLARRWTTALSFTLQAGTVAAALALPLLYPNSLPEALTPRRIFVPISQGNVHAQRSQTSSSTASALSLTPLVVNRSNFSFRPEADSASESNGLQPPVIGIEDGANVLNSVIEDSFQSLPRAPAAAIAHPRISALMEGNLIHRVEPQYPPVAQTAGIQGTVIINALISRNGAIERVDVVSGSPLLARAALEAVRQWRYRPYLLNGEAVEVETQITVHFLLNR